MTCNKNGIPNDPQKPMNDGIRLGTPALTRGFRRRRGAPEPHRRRTDAPRQHRRGAHQITDARLPGLPLSACSTSFAAPGAPGRERPGAA
jgi:hypothetical protein